MDYSNRFLNVEPTTLHTGNKFHLHGRFGCTYNNKFHLVLVYNSSYRIKFNLLILCESCIPLFIGDIGL